MMARHPRSRSLSSTGHYAAGCITVTLLAALSLILLRSPAAERRCDLSSYDPASTEALDLKRCKLSTLPVAIAEFRRLKKLDLGFNSLQALPALPSSLEVLFLLANRFEEVAPLGLGSGLSQAKRPA
jgi:Leucine-rich repeat (LRR) protein